VTASLVFAAVAGFVIGIALGVGAAGALGRPFGRSLLPSGYRGRERRVGRLNAPRAGVLDPRAHRPVWGLRDAPPTVPPADAGAPPTLLGPIESRRNPEEAPPARRPNGTDGSPRGMAAGEPRPVSDSRSAPSSEWIDDETLAALRTL